MTSVIRLWWTAAAVALIWTGCQSTPEPASAGDQQGPAAEGASASGFEPEEGVSCPEADLAAYRGEVVDQGGGAFALRGGDAVVPLWESSQQAAVAPSSPDLSRRVGEQVVLCGDFDGSALYRVRPPASSL